MLIGFRKYLIIFILGIIFVSAGMMGQILPVLTKPLDRLYTGLEGFPDDYNGYVSYVKEGMYGLWTFRIRSVPPPQPSTTVHMIYVLIGKPTALLGWDAPTGYHFFRAVFGFVFFMSLAVFLIKSSGSYYGGILATILAVFSSGIGWYQKIDGIWVYNTLTWFGFTDNTALRFSSRPHYLFTGFLFTVIAYIQLFTVKPKAVHIFLTAFLSFIISITHPAFAVLLGVTSGVMVATRLFRTRNLSYVIFNLYGSAGLGLVPGLIASYVQTRQYPLNWVLAFESYVKTEMLSLATIKSDLISFGPVFALGLAGLIIINIKNKFSKEVSLYMLVWISVQLLLFFRFYKIFGTERVRYVQSLYFIPIAYGMYSLLSLFKSRTGKAISGLLYILVLASMLSPYVFWFFKALYYHTDYKHYSLFIFPTRNIMSAYKWLDQNTPLETVVIADYEAANNILLYSHNYVIGNPQSWPKGDKENMEYERFLFFTGSRTETEAKEYLKKYNISYVYDGYQEADGFRKYSFLEKVYENPEAGIYKIIY